MYISSGMFYIYMDAYTHTCACAHTHIHIIYMVLYNYERLYEQILYRRKVDLYFIHVTGIVLCATLVSSCQHHQCDKAKCHTLYQTRNYQHDCGELHCDKNITSFQFVVVTSYLNWKMTRRQSSITTTSQLTTIVNYQLFCQQIGDGNIEMIEGYKYV